MPFDIAADPAPIVQSVAQEADLGAAFAAAAAPKADWAVANPDRALAFLMVAPQPCESLDVLLAA